MRCSSVFVHRGILNIYSNGPAGRVIRSMLYVLVILAPLLACLTAWK
jgi:hypothetical protein